MGRSHSTWCLPHRGRHSQETPGRPVETKTCTAPALAGAGLALGFTFERTSAGETSDQVTVSEGWEKLEFAAQEGLNYQTVTLAKRTAAAPADLVVTYPNVQGSNGLGVQVVARG